MVDLAVVVGTGLVGGSVAYGLRAAGLRVRGVDADAANAKAALDLGAVDETAPTVADAVSGASLVVVATPVGEILATIAEVADAAPAGCVVTDVGSTKSAIVAEADRLLGTDRPFVGGHPMAGTEGEGIASARPDLFGDALWILTPTDATDPAAYRRINALVTELGARTLALDPVEHDRLVALVSHLPYAVATALMVLAGREGDERVFRAAAGSFRDVTRTAGSNPRVWRDIFATNRDAVLRELDTFGATLGAIRDAVAGSRWDELDGIIEQAREARRRFPTKGERAPSEPMTVEVSIPDRTGVLAEITTAIGEAGINIEDLWVDHGPAGGVLRIVVDGTAQARTASEVLRARGFATVTVSGR